MALRKKINSKVWEVKEGVMRQKGDNQVGDGIESRENQVGAGGARRKSEGFQVEVRASQEEVRRESGRSQVDQQGVKREPEGS